MFGYESDNDENHDPAYLDAMCGEAHSDRGSCFPVWDGTQYFCPDKRMRDEEEARMHDQMV